MTADLLSFIKEQKIEMDYLRWVKKKKMIGMSPWRKGFPESIGDVCPSFVWVLSVSFSSGSVRPTLLCEGERSLWNDPHVSVSLLSQPSVMGFPTEQRMLPLCVQTRALTPAWPHTLCQVTWIDCLQWLSHLHAQQDLEIFATVAQRALLKCQSGKHSVLLKLMWQNPRGVSC